MAVMMAHKAENQPGDVVTFTPDELRSILQAHFRAFVSEIGVSNENGKARIVVRFPGPAPAGCRLYRSGQSAHPEH